MIFPRKYKCLQKNNFSIGKYKITPIRFKDRIYIMNWRNEQMYHLRQKSILNIQDQNNYFKNVVLKLFNKKNPEQILFSYILNNKCIGYGGLVHINWNKKYAEISFIMETSLESEYFHFHWKNFLLMIEKIGFDELDFEKLNTYAYDLRPHLYNVLEDNGYKKIKEEFSEKILDNKKLKVIIHSKSNS